MSVPVGASGCADRCEFTEGNRPQATGQVMVGPLSLCSAVWGGGGGDERQSGFVGSYFWFNGLGFGLCRRCCRAVCGREGGGGVSCSTGIRWGVSPAAQMGCLRNRSGSPSGADQP